MFELDLLGGQEFDTELLALASGLDDPETWLLGFAAPLAGKAVRDKFEAGGLPDTWPDITAKSRAARKVNKSSGPLIDSGALMEAASAGKPGITGSLFAVTGDMLTLGTDLVYAGVQQDGSEGKNIPARPYEFLTDTDEIRLSQSMDDDYLHKLIAAMG